MSSYETIRGRTMTLQTDNEVDYSGVSISDDRPGSYRVVWSWNLNSQTGGITGINWPNEIKDQVLVLISQISLGTAVEDDVSSIVYYYTNRLLQVSDPETMYDFYEFRDDYNAGGANCVQFAF